MLPVFLMMLVAAWTPQLDGVDKRDYEGVWDISSAVIDGDPVLMRSQRQEFQGDRLTVFAGAKVVSTATVKVVETAGQKVIEYNFTNGNMCKSLYKIEGDVLTVCSSGPNLPSPTDFTSPKGEKRMLTTWKRRPK